MTVLLMWAGCWGKADPPARPEDEYEVWIHVYDFSAGDAPWSSVYAAVDQDDLVRIEIDEVVADPIEPGRYQLSTELAIGEHLARIIGPDGEIVESLSFTTRPYGRDAAFEPSSLVGRSWQLGEIGRSHWGAVVEDSLWGTRFQVTAADPEAGTVHFRVLDEDFGCLVHESDAVVSATGELWWDQAMLVAESPEGPAPLYDLSLHLGWDGDDIGGLEVYGLVDTAPWSRSYLSLDEEAYFCMFGCVDCPDVEESPYCHPWDSVEGSLVEAERSSTEMLPLCVAGEYTIESDCGCVTTGFLVPGGLGWLFLLRIRQRRGQARVRG